MRGRIGSSWILEKYERIDTHFVLVIGDAEYIP
jgi:hypothetical protein